MNYFIDYFIFLFYINYTKFYFPQYNTFPWYIYFVYVVNLFPAGVFLTISAAENIYGIRVRVFVLRIHVSEERGIFLLRVPYIYMYM